MKCILNGILFVLAAIGSLVYLTFLAICLTIWLLPPYVCGRIHYIWKGAKS